ncbi:MAG TPA: hypothetical protein VF134_02015 [Candidatus Dormibacteraeota bacterium]
MRASLIPPRPSLRWLAAIAGAGILVGLAVALASGVQSLNDVTRSAGAGSGAAASEARLFPSASPAAEPTAVPPASVAGRAGAAPRLYAADARHLLLVGVRAYLSADGGVTWSPLPDSSGEGVVPDSGQPQRMIAGGSSVWTTANGGSGWQQVTNLPGASQAPYVALAINPDDPTVWFFAAGPTILRTRDAGHSWKLGLGGVPAPLDHPVLRPAGAKDAFALASGRHVYLLRDNGQAVDDLGALPASDSGAPVVDLAGLGGGSYAAAGADGTVYVLSGGAWAAVAPVAPVAPVGVALAAGSGRVVVAGGGGRLGAPGVAWASGDGGATWTAAAGLPKDESIEAVAFASDGSAFAYGFGGDLYASSNGGGSWTLRSTALRG